MSPDCPQCPQTSTRYTKASESGRIDGKGGLSGQTRLHHFRVLNKALSVAELQEKIARNVCDAVRKPAVDRGKVPSLDAPRALKLLEMARATSMDLPVALALGTGLRRGEVLGLMWSDLDLEAGTLTVRRSLETTSKGGLAFKLPKSKQSRRTVTLPLFVVEAIIRHKARQMEHRLALGASYQDQGLVMAGATGGPMHPDSTTTMFRRLAKKAGCPEVTFHGLRHSHATLALSQGTPLRTISERLGHSDAALTLRTYARVLPGQQEEVADKIGRLLGS